MIDDSIWLSDVLRMIDSKKLNENDVAIPDDAKDPAAAIDSAKSKLTWFGIGMRITFSSTIRLPS